MNIYTTLRGEVIDLDKLTDEQRAAYKKLKDFIDTNNRKQTWSSPAHIQLHAFWMKIVREREIFKGVKDRINNPLRRIYSDLETQLCLDIQRQREKK